MPKNITAFWQIAKILMPKTTNRKAMTLITLAMRNVCQLADSSQLAPLAQPANWKVDVRPGSIVNGAST